MLRRLKIEHSQRPRQPAWPESTERHRGPLFASRARHRKLTVLLDDDVLPETQLTAWGKPYLLAGLLSLEEIDCFRYAGDGPPSNVDEQVDDYLGTYVRGWAVLDPGDESGTRGVRAATSNTITDNAIFSDLAQVAAADTTTSAYTDLSEVEAAERRRRDAFALLVADAVGADLFITRRPYLYEKQWGVAGGVTLVDVDDALALVGLYARAQDTYITSRGPTGRGTHTMNRGLFYWVGTRELLPAGWRWFSACLQHSHGGGDERLVFVAQSVLQRVQRALQVRDEVHVGLNKPQVNDTADQVLASTDVLLLPVMGAADATARVAHSTLGLTMNPHDSGWQRERWMKAVSKEAPDLGKLFEPGTDQSHALTILRLLRNAIHGEALQPLSVGVPRRRERTLVGLPTRGAAKVTQAIEALGGAEEWGVESVIPGRLHFDPGVFVEELLPQALAMLNSVMDNTPVERLSNVSLMPSDSLPARDSRLDTFNEMNRQSIRWQLGL